MYHHKDDLRKALWTDTTNLYCNNTMSRMFPFALKILLILKRQCLRVEEERDSVQRGIEKVTTEYLDYRAPFKFSILDSCLRVPNLGTKPKTTIPSNSCKRRLWKLQGRNARWPGLRSRRKWPLE